MLVLFCFEIPFAEVDNNQPRPTLPCLCATLRKPYTSSSHLTSRRSASSRLSKDSYQDVEGLPKCTVTVAQTSKEPKLNCRLCTPNRIVQRSRLGPPRKASSGTLTPPLHPISVDCGRPG